MQRMMLALALAASTAATPTLAQDAEQGRANFTGPRIEGRSGYSNQTVEVFTPASLAPFGLRDTVNTSAVLLGVGAGYDLDLGGIIIGVEAGVDWTVAEDRTGFGLRRAGRIDDGRDIEVGGRIGFRADDNIMFYAKGAYVNLDYLREETGFNDLGQVVYSAGIDRNISGWRAGGGVEYALPLSIYGTAAYAKLEYRHSEYEEDVTRDEAVLGVGVRF